MKILVVGGIHGNEPLGTKLVSRFKADPQKNVGAILANERAVAKNKRFINTDLNRSFPGNIKSLNYEEKRAAELIDICRKYDLVLDFHNTHCPDNDCTFVGENALPSVYSVASWFNLSRVIVANYDCINKYAGNCLSVEVSLTSKRMDAESWYILISELAKKNELPPASNLKRYKFTYRITLEDRDRFNLGRLNLKAFKAIPKELAISLGVDSPAYPIFIADQYTPYNYGGLVNRIIE